MAPQVRRSVLEGFFLAASGLLTVGVAVSVAAAQHAAGHVAGAGVPAHASGPPISHAPLARSPIWHAPVVTPHISSAPFASTMFFHPPWRPIRPPLIRVYEFPIFAGPFLGFNSCGWANCDLLWPWAFGYDAVSFAEYGPATSVPSPPYAASVYVYGAERADFPQLFLKDGTVLNVTDYWVVDGQLHFTMIEEEGTKAAEEVIPFEQLDLQKTIDVNTGRGFRFMLRNEPFEQYVRDHPAGSPEGSVPQQ